ncbi:MAG: chemotaxis protein CheA [Alphaproteobacteria bacterium]|nr:chemotaxis protein CheA [Alphaproteobacteria bacterium]
MDDLLTEFIAETREMLGALGGAIVAWEGAPGDRARLDEIFRFVHTVKGNSGFFDLPRITALSHAAEDALAAVRSGARQADHNLVSAVLAAIDRLGELVQAIETGDSVASADDEALIEALSRAEPAPPPELEAASSVVAAPRVAARSIRLPVDLLDRMMSGVSDLVLARNALARRLRDGGADAEVAACFERVSGSIADLRDAITRTRMQRIDNLFAALPRMVRDIGTETGKKVALEVDGGDVELDREMIEMIRDPLTHIVRNAIDHGIEGADERRRAGKPDQGRLHVCARQTGNQILIEVADDGRGLDGGRLVEKALAAGLLDEARAARLTPQQRNALIFEPGLSTAREVTNLSGRGVGMDVVRANVERIGGVVEVDSREGEGVTFTLRVPLTLTIIPALTVRACGQAFAIPRSAIEEIVRVNGGAVRIEPLGRAAVATVRDRRMPLVDFPGLIGLPAATDADGRMLVVLKPAGGGLYALAVDAVQDHEELVVKPAAPAVMAAGLYAGTTLADDGQPVLLLDPPGIAARAGISLARKETVVEDATAPERTATPFLLFRTVGGAKRMVEAGAAQRIEDLRADAVRATAGRLRVAIGDAILPLEGCAEAPPEERFRALRLTDGAGEIAYAVREVIDMVAFAGEAIPAPAPGEVRGVALVAGEQVEILDLHWLFGRHAAPAAGDRRPICLLAADDPFAATILRPLVETAGYEVRFEGDGADVAIVSEDAAPPPAARILRLTSAAGVASEGSIDRYDRAALLAALAEARKRA